MHLVGSVKHISSVNWCQFQLLFNDFTMKSFLIFSFSSFNFNLVYLFVFFLFRFLTQDTKNSN